MTRPPDGVHPPELGPDRPDLESVLARAVRGVTGIEDDIALREALATEPGFGDDIALAKAMRQDIEARVAAAPAEAGLAELRRRLAQDRQTEARGTATASVGWLGRLRDSLLGPRTSLALAAIVAIEGVALLALAPARPPQAEAPTDFRAATPAVPVVKLSFRPGATEAEACQALIAAKARIVDGPSPLGAYTLSPPDGVSAQVLAERLSALSIVESATVSHAEDR